MLEKGFRALRADEVDVRIGTVKAPDNVKKTAGGVSLLLYKDARCDMNVLDETVGPLNWQKSYSRDNANCTVSIWDDDKRQWISKEDTGTESNTEAEKGLASDSFKRACFNWGIGRELYTAPFIWISGANKYDKFRVKEMEVQDHRITRLVITNVDKYGVDKVVAFSFGQKAEQPEEKPEEVMPAPESPVDPDAPITADDWKVLQKTIKDYGVKPSDVLQYYGLQKPNQISNGLYGIIVTDLPAASEIIKAAYDEQQTEG